MFAYSNQEPYKSMRYTWLMCLLKSLNLWVSHTLKLKKNKKLMFAVKLIQNYFCFAKLNGNLTL